MTSAKAIKECKNRTTGGYAKGSWRLPAVKELFGIVDPMRRSMAINTTYFPDSNTYGRQYWSATRSPLEEDNRSPTGHKNWTVEFNSGVMLREFINSPLANKEGFYVRCVLGENKTSDFNFTNNGNTTTTDNNTGLMWQRSMMGDKTRSDAVKYCGNLTAGGHTDWRLPNIFELVSIADFNKIPGPKSRRWAYTMLDETYFPTGDSHYSFWASTLNKSHPDYGWTFRFDGGMDNTAHAATAKKYVRCVRSGSGALALGK